MMDLNRRIGLEIDRQRDKLSEAITERQYELNPELATRYGEAGWKRCLQDALYHLSYLCESIVASRPSLFADYIAWAKIMLAARGIPTRDLVRNLEIMREKLVEVLPEEMAVVVGEYIGVGLAQLPQISSDLPTCIQEGEPLADLATEYLNALMRGERHIASRLILDAVKDGKDIKDIYLHVFQRSQYEIGRLWQMNRISVGQEHFCTAATQLIISQLYPYIFSSEKNGRTLVATCVAGELHELGIRMIADFFELYGWSTYYLGANTPIPDILKTIKERRADLVAISATITFNVRAVKEMIATLRSSEDCKGVKVMVGGYPFNVASDLWQEVRADGYANDAMEAIAVANRLFPTGPDDESF
jgi:MerR family transcriptional regulator, light-induced transcriptional regulator